MADLAVGMMVLEYADRISSIVLELRTASEKAHRAADLLLGEAGVYEGGALAEMGLFY